MLGRQRHALPRGAAAALAVALCVASGAAIAAEPCALAVNVEGHPQGAVLRERLTAIARQEGACTSQTWALRVAPGPKGTYVVALWNGSDLETRFASQSEVEPVASILLRVALERQRQGKSPGTTQDGAAAADTATTSTPSDPPPPTTSRDPSVVKAGPSLSLGIEAGPAFTNAGAGAAGGIFALLRGRHLGVGVFGRYGAQGTAPQSRRAIEAGALGAIGAPLGERAWLGGVVELGVSLQRADGQADGNDARFSASGATIGGGLMALYQPTRHLQLGARLVGNWSSPEADPAEITATTAKNNGKGKGLGANKTVTTTTVDPASRNAAEALGGGAVSLFLGVGYAF